MKKELISLDNLDAFVCMSAPRVYVDSATSILTPGARDEIAWRGLEIVNGPCPDYAACGHKSHGIAGPDVNEDVLVGIAAILKKDHGVTDPEQLKRMTLEVVAAMRKLI